MDNQTHTIETQNEGQKGANAGISDSEMLQEIYENTRKTKNYMKWQLIITVALVVIPLLATLLVIPFALRSLTSIYSSTGITEGVTDSLQGNLNQETVQGLIDQYTK